MKKHSYRGFGFYVLLIVVVVVVWLMLDARESEADAYTLTELETALDKDEVIFIEIEQNREIPTGILEVHLKNASVRKLYVSDVHEVQGRLKEK